MERRPVWTMLTVVVLGLAGTACGQETNVALAATGATVWADSELFQAAGYPGGQAVPARLIDGVIPPPGSPPEEHRWHSHPLKPHPHWVWIRFARPAKISKLVLWYNVPTVAPDGGIATGGPWNTPFHYLLGAGAPVDFAGQSLPNGGRSLQTLFRREKARLDAANPSVTVEFPPVVTDNFRLLITRSSNAEFPDYTQLSEIQVFGQWMGERPPARARPAPQRRRGEIKDGPLPKGLKVEATENQLAFVSPWLKIIFDLNRPSVRRFSLDGAGSGKHTKNLLKGTRGIDAVVRTWNDEILSADASFVVSRSGNTVRYEGIQLGSWETLDLTYTVHPKGLHIAIDRRVPTDYLTEESSPLRMLWDPKVTPLSPLGRLKSPGELRFPVVFHFPDHGTLVVRATGSESTLKFVGRRQQGEVQLALSQAVRITPEATTIQQAGQHHVELDMALTSIYPAKALVDADPKLAGVKRAWLNIFGFRPDIATLSNNSVSDPAILCMHEFADQAYYTPPLVDDFTALDMVRTSLDAYFDGLPSYTRFSAWFVDADPAVVISAWDYATGKPDLEWLRRRIGHIEKCAEHIIAADVNGDGLAESIVTGNSGVGPKGGGGLSSNWWDVISFGWNDAYATALDYRAFRCAADLERRLGRPEKAEIYRKRAARIKAVYHATFYNPQTGVLAGWRSKDGTLHDYYFAFVNGIAVAYGLVTPGQGHAIMDRMQAKMRAVGYTNFRIGMPGNLIPIARKDYSGGGVMGKPSKDDGSDSFQNYENGAATGSFAYFYIQALYTLGRKAEADAIFEPMLEGYRDGVFQNGLGSGVDWKRWDGTPCGYEGLLADTYYALTALLTGRLGRGVPIP